MDFFQHRYYTLTKTLMTLIGQWPYQSTRVRRGFLAIIILINSIQIVPAIAAFVKYRHDPTIFLDSFIALIFVAICVSKLICFLWNSQRTLLLVNRIRTDWQVWARDREVDILHEYTEQGKKAIVLYTAMIYSSLFIFIIEPVIPKIIDILLMNSTEPGRFPFPVEYNYFNAQKYYFYIIMYSLVCTSVMCTVLIASDVMLIVYVQHGCGLFAALGHKLQRIGNDVSSPDKGKSRYDLEKRDMINLASCIDRHNGAIEYAKLVESIYAWLFFVLIGLGMILTVVIGLQILRKNDPKSAVRLVVFVSASTVLFFIMSYLSQILMDHSNRIDFYIHNSQWYRLSPKVQKWLQLMTMRCAIPCQLTIGKLFIMCMKTFGLIVRTTLSYFMMLRTMQIDNIVH